MINIAKLRREKKLTLRALAKKCSVSRQTVLMVERDRGSVTTALKVLGALGVPMKQRTDYVFRVYFKSRPATKPTPMSARTATAPA